MADIPRVALFGKLNRFGYQTIEAATVVCKQRGHRYIELVHWVEQLLNLKDSDWQRIIRHFEIAPTRLAIELAHTLSQLATGATTIADFSAHIEETIERGWVYSTLLFGDAQIRTGHLLVGILKTPSLRAVLMGISREFTKIKVETLTERFADIVSGSPEQQLTATDGWQSTTVPSGGAESVPTTAGKQTALQRFAVDLTAKARRGELDTVVGRDDEIRQLIDILMRRRQNNPILTGEAGVGKTAVVEGFAVRIVKGEVPPPLREVSLHALDLGLLQAGAGVKGEFESRLKSLIDEVQASAKPVILFIDEAHTLMGAGGTAGTGDAANLLKPALARGTLRTVAATTWAEYKKYIEKDPALTRRFQVVQVHEPDETKAIQMLRGIVGALEQHHRVQILDEAVVSAVKLSHRYIAARQLPDKAVSVLDTACARVAVNLHAVPAAVETCQRRIEALKTSLALMRRDAAIGLANDKQLADIETQLQQEQQRLPELEARWNKEKSLITGIVELRQKLRSAVNESTAQPTSDQDVAHQDAVNRDAANQETAENVVPVSETTAPTPSELPTPLPTLPSPTLFQQLTALQAELHDLQGDQPFMSASVDGQVIASVVADWTGIPVGRMVKDEITAVLNLADTLNQRVLGQRHALDVIARRVQTSRARLDNPNKPIGVFLLVGPSGVGKTETALALAEALYGGEQNLITINMSEFQEAHTVSTLKGAPPGYVGYGEGGVLTEAVRRKPYSVVLLDEVEKAHPDVHEIFFQVFDKGWMEDGEGRFIDFKNTLILLTSNAGSEVFTQLCRGDAWPTPEVLAAALRGPLLDVFPAALLGRLVVVPYYPLGDALLAEIAKLQLNRIVKRVLEHHQIPLTYSDDVLDLIVSRCTETESGARMIDAILTNTVLPALSTAFLNHMLEGQPLNRVVIRVEHGDLSYLFE